MRNNIEERFFEVFGIEPIATKYECRWGTGSTKHTVDTCKSQFCDKEYCNQKQVGVFYPQITSGILLELICICSHYEPLNDYKVTLEELKNNCLEKLIELADIDWIKDEVQSLFTEVGESIHNGDDKLNKTLQEIKEIAENEIKELTDSAINGGRYLEILNLIKEAEEEIMTEIEKLYELIGIKAKEYCERDSDLCFTGCPLYSMRSGCKKYFVKMPPFTAEKQLELIKWLARKSNLIRIGYHNKENTYHIFSNEAVGGFHYNFSESIVTYIQCILDFCDETEKEEIRKILKG